MTDRLITTDLLRAAENEIRDLGKVIDERYDAGLSYGTEEVILGKQRNAIKQTLRDLDLLCHSLARLELSDAELSMFDRDNRRR